MNVTVEPNAARRVRLLELAAECREVYSDEAKEALEAGPVPRFAMLCSEGTSESSYSDNPDLTVHDTVEDLAEHAARQAGDDWTPKQMVDLDTGDELEWEIKVIVTPPDDA